MFCLLNYARNEKRQDYLAWATRCSGLSDASIVFGRGTHPHVPGPARRCARGPVPHYRLSGMVLSDRSIREALSAGHISIDPLDEDCIQPSSVDLHVDQYFRLFRNHTSRVIDVREDQEDLTELVDVGTGSSSSSIRASSYSVPPPRR